MPIDGKRVILDYCHNVDGMRRLAEFVGLMMAGNGRGRTGANGAGDGSAATREARAVAVIGMPGDRRDEDHLEFGRIAAHAFDEIIVREDRNRRGRKPGESAELVKRGIEKGMAEQGARTTTVKIVTDEQEAAATGIRDADQGDLVMLCSDDIAAVYRRVVAEAQASGSPAIADPGELEVEEG